jgi:hypothetical protein
MNRTRQLHPIRRLASALAGLAAALLAVTAAAPAAFASRMPPPEETAGPVPPPVHTIVTGGMPGWQIALIAIAAAATAAAVAVILDRARTARRHQPAPSA